MLKLLIRGWIILDMFNSEDGLTKKDFNPLFKKEFLLWIILETVFI